MKNTFNKTAAFQAWITALKDNKGRARIFARIDAAKLGHFGDCAPVGEGVSEMRIHYGPGYRVYFAQQERVVYLLLVGGDKGSQPKDIEKAKNAWREVKEKLL